MKLWIIVVIAFLVFHLLINLVRYIQCRYYLDVFFTWLATGKKGIQLLQGRSTIKKLIKDANLSDPRLPWVQPTGYGLVASSTISVFDNFPSRYEDIARVTTQYINDAIGVYRSRCWQTFNPLYWIQAIIFLPRSVMSYLGASPETISVKLLQLLWWLIVSVGTVAFALYKDELKTVIELWIESLMK